jgi:hypothetical protein
MIQRTYKIFLDICFLKKYLFPKETIHEGAKSYYEKADFSGLRPFSTGSNCGRCP